MLTEQFTESETAAYIANMLNKFGDWGSIFSVTALIFIHCCFRKSSGLASQMFLALFAPSCSKYVLMIF
uniref:Uncharacterized protein n=1 Tax=Rhizophora mucronata TaxID=61149 RepID=A0A2P2NNS2_RHIMU